MAGRAIDETHPTWVAISVLVVMWPEWQKTYQRVLQRVFGSLFIPYGVRRTYWLHCALMALVVFLGMRLAKVERFTRHPVEERVIDIVLGCCIAVLGTLFAFRRRDRLVLE